MKAIISVRIMTAVGCMALALVVLTAGAQEPTPTPTPTTTPSPLKDNWVLRAFDIGSHPANVDIGRETAGLIAHAATTQLVSGVNNGTAIAITQNMTGYLDRAGTKLEVSLVESKVIRTKIVEGAAFPPLRVYAIVRADGHFEDLVKSLQDTLDKVSDTADGAIQRLTKLESELPEMVPKAAVVALAKQTTALEGRLKALETARAPAATKVKP